jgi:hypothetical protein
VCAARYALARPEIAVPGGKMWSPAHGNGGSPRGRVCHTTRVPGHGYRSWVRPRPQSAPRRRRVAW